MEVFYTDEFWIWYQGLSPDEEEELDFVIRLLDLLGVKLGHPHSSALKACRHPLRELRPKKGKSPFRVIYAFDPRRDAVLLIGGDKRRDKKLYERLIQDAEKIWEDYLAEQTAGLHDCKEEP